MASTSCHACHVASADARRCSRCRTAVYCSKTCQATDWREGHRKVCAPPSPGGVSDVRKLHYISRLSPPAQSPWTQQLLARVLQHCIVAPEAYDLAGMFGRAVRITTADVVAAAAMMPSMCGACHATGVGVAATGECTAPGCPGYTMVLPPAPM